MSMYLYLMVYGIIICLDLLSKFWALEFLGNSFIEVIHFLHLGPVLINRGISFGMLEFIPNINMILFVCNTVLVIVLLYFACRKNMQGRIYMHVLCAGALSNLIDRIQHQGVVDFIHVYIGKYSFPVFNVADSCITISVILMLSRDTVIYFKK
ncbi:MAG: signal peptidase II [Candidatus Xenolissoclinum pacificiensis L6]|uniref:Lipoprotein signal peptidase n=1 Tax=Candidatus Xenolissoclinum pacificiensis L6 TaxID=1401685 RepID=W2V0H0_9RICK|nr:MAG: signal peptidase II [Candidatus Xenolissoclinum pacificiensis L6]